MTDPSLLSPRHVIPQGTQVVLMGDLAVAAGERARPFKNRGSVGKVEESPLDRVNRASVDDGRRSSRNGVG